MSSERMRLRWRNIPVPEAHVGGIILGTILQLVLPRKLVRVGWLARPVGWPLLLSGAGLAFWAVVQAGESDIAAPDRLLTGGPYVFSRNPMYVGWALIYLGISFLSNMRWPIMLMPLVVAYIHRVDIRQEEGWLEEQFGEQYLAYRQRVRRYL